MVDSTRRKLVKAGAAATVVAAAGRVLGQTSDKKAAGSFYKKGQVSIHYEEAGSGFPLLVIPGGGLNSTIAALSKSISPFNPMVEFKDEYRCIGADLRNAVEGQSSGPLEADRPWDA